MQSTVSIPRAILPSPPALTGPSFSRTTSVCKICALSFRDYYGSVPDKACALIAVAQITVEVKAALTHWENEKAR